MNIRHEIHWEKPIKALLLVLLIIMVTVFAKNLNFSAILLFLQKYPELSALVFLCGYVLLGITPLTTEPLTLCIVSFRGPLLAIALATVGNTLAALVEYFLGDAASDLSDFEKRKSNLPFRLGELPINSARFLLLSRMVPWFGSKFVSVVCGAYKVSLFTFTWTTFFANLLGALIIAYGGFGLIQAILALV